jgi:hypothetical protein
MCVCYWPRGGGVVSTVWSCHSSSSSKTACFQQPGAYIIGIQRTALGFDNSGKKAKKVDISATPPMHNPGFGVEVFKGVLLVNALSRNVGASSWWALHCGRGGKVSTCFTP